MNICDEQLTVKHILTDCEEYRLERLLCYNKDGIQESLSLEEALGDNKSVTNTINFLRAIAILHNI